MPYRLKPNDKRVVQVKRGDRWVQKKRFPAAAKAGAHLRALQANVRHK